MPALPVLQTRTVRQSQTPPASPAYYARNKAVLPSARVRNITTITTSGCGLWTCGRGRPRLLLLSYVSACRGRGQHWLN